MNNLARFQLYELGGDYSYNSDFADLAEPDFCLLARHVLPCSLCLLRHSENSSSNIRLPFIVALYNFLELYKFHLDHCLPFILANFTWIMEVPACSVRSSKPRLERPPTPSAEKNATTNIEGSHWGWGRQSLNYKKNVRDNSGNDSDQGQDQLGWVEVVEPGWRWFQCWPKASGLLGKICPSPKRRCLPWKSVYFGWFLHWTDFFNTVSEKGTWFLNKCERSRKEKSNCQGLYSV